MHFRSCNSSFAPGGNAPSVRAKIPYNTVADGVIHCVRPSGIPSPLRITPTPAPAQPRRMFVVTERYWSRKSRPGGSSPGPCENPARVTVLTQKKLGNSGSVTHA